MNLIVHRGLSEPLCPHAEITSRISIQSDQGHTEKRCIVVSAVTDNQNQIRYRLITIADLLQKNIGDQNAMLNEGEYKGWWTHIITSDRINYALLGRPNKRILGPQYQIQEPHLISTTVWRLALKQLHNDKPFKEEFLIRKFPRLASSFDTSRSPLE